MKNQPALANNQVKDIFISRLPALLAIPLVLSIFPKDAHANIKTSNDVFPSTTSEIDKPVFNIHKEKQITGGIWYDGVFFPTSAK